ncbi:universal stress protein, partial [Thauera sp.]
FIKKETLDEIKVAGRNQAESLLQQRIDIFAEAHPDMDVKSVLTSVRALEGEPARQILDMAKHTLADMIVMGSRGHSAIGELLIGSVAHKVTMKADVPVVLVPIDR